MITVVVVCGRDGDCDDNNNVNNNNNNNNLTQFN